MPRLTHRWIDPQDRSEFLHIFCRQEAVVRGGLARHIHATLAALDDGRQARSRRQVEDVDLCSRMRGEQPHPLNRLHLRQDRPGLQVRQWIFPSRHLKLLDAALHDLIVLGVKRAAHAKRRDDAHALQEPPVIRRPDVAGRSPEKTLEAHHPGFSHRTQVLDAVLGQQTQQAEIAIRLRFGKLPFLLHQLSGAGGGQRIRHVEDRRDTTHHGGARARAEVFFVLEARLAEMDVAVDHAGQHVPCCCIEHVGRRVGLELTWRRDRCDPFVVDTDVRAVRVGGRDQRPVSHHQSERAHPGAPSGRDEV